MKNFFDYGFKVTQFIHLRLSAISKMCFDYSALVLVINNIDDFLNRLVLSKITKETSYEYANSMQGVLEVTNATKFF